MKRWIEFALLVFSVLGFACGQGTTGRSSESSVPDSSATAKMVQADAITTTTTTSKPVLTYIQQKGQRLYDHYCAVCHGAEGAGDGFNAYNLNPKPKDMTRTGYLAAVTNDYLIEAIMQGGRGVKRSVLMPSYEKTLSKAQIEAIVAYLRLIADTP